jgi:hypothetical protein
MTIFPHIEILFDCDPKKIFPKGLSYSRPASRKVDPEKGAF